MIRSTWYLISARTFFETGEEQRRVYRVPDQLTDINSIQFVLDDLVSNLSSLINIFVLLFCPEIKKDTMKNLGNDTREGNSVELVSSSGSDSELAMHNSKPLPPQLPNLLSNQPVMDFITGLSAKELNSCSNARLQLFGGVDGFIDVVTNEFNVKIDIKTISSLINFVNSDLEEEKLLDHMRQERVKPDIDFFNQLMRRKVERNDYKGTYYIVTGRKM